MAAHLLTPTMCSIRHMFRFTHTPFIRASALTETPQESSVYMITIYYHFTFLVNFLWTPIHV